MEDLSRLCVHTITTRPWSLAEAVEHYARAGVRGVTVWRDVFETVSPKAARRMLADAGLSIVSLCRGGFFPAADAEGRRKSIDDNLRALDQAAEMGAPLVVLVCGAVPGLPLAEARRQIADGIAAVLPAAEARSLRLSVEPLHPMYAADRSAINTLAQANDVVERLNHPNLGVTVDVYHLWWDPDLEQQIARAGRRIFSFHVSDWRVPTRDLLSDRGLPGEGCIPVRQIRSRVEAAGFDGFVEVEIFSDHYWAMDQRFFLDRIIASARAHV
ncbi:sugar phosphate isomerase/epimerase [bacterium]|nr:sugar phosphate isomerase/epimerase [bacterium]